MKGKKGSRPEDRCLYCNAPIGFMGLAVCPGCRKTKCVAYCIPGGKGGWCIECKPAKPEEN